MAPLNVPFDSSDGDVYAHLSDEDWALQQRIDKRFTASLTVEQRKEENLVYYDIFSGDNDEILIKETRFSELDAFHRILIKEVPDFEGTLPWAKDATTMYQRQQRSQSQKTSLDESRRAGIELYLRMVATKQAALGSKALRGLFLESRLSDPTARDVKKALVVSKYNSTKKTRQVRTSILAGFDLEMAQELNARREALDEAVVAKQRLERSLQQGEQAAEMARAQLQAKADTEDNCAQKLESHRKNLQDFNAQLEARKAWWHERQGEQETTLARLKEQLAAASKSTRVARKRFSTVCDTGVKASEAACVHIREADDAVNAAVLESTVAVQRKAAMSAALSALQEAVVKVEREAKDAEWEKGMRREAADTLKQQGVSAEFALSAAQDAADAAKKAVASDAKATESSQRLLDTEIRRAKELAGAAAKLRDMQTRKKVIGKGRQALEATEPALMTGAEAASQLFINNTDKMVKQKSADKERRTALEAKVEHTTKELKNREKAAAALAARVEEAELEAYNAAGLYEAAKAAVEAVHQEYENMKSLIEGPLTVDVKESSSKLKAGRDDSAKRRKQSEEEASAQRHAEEAERKVLLELEQAELQLVEAQDRTAIAVQDASEELVYLEELHEDPTWILAHQPIQVSKVTNKELAIVAEHLQKHRGDERVVLKKLNERAVEWKEQKESLSTQLHEATLTESLAKEAVVAATSLQEAMVI